MSNFWNKYVPILINKPLNSRLMPFVIESPVRFSLIFFNHPSPRRPPARAEAPLLSNRFILKAALTEGFNSA
jgi:hypothetical protein